MAFGAFAPLPLRLGGSATEGWTAAQHARACADLVALKRAAPFAVLTFSLSGDVATILSYKCQASNARPPDVQALGLYFPGADVEISWPDSARVAADPYGVVHPVPVPKIRAMSSSSSLISVTYVDPFDIMLELHADQTVTMVF